MDIITYAIVKKYINERLVGMGIGLTDEEVMQSLIAANVLSAVTSGGAILTDENNNILMI